MPDWTNDRAIIAARMRFHDALTGRLVIMRALGGANAGLEAVLQGKDKKLLADIGDKDIKIELKDIKGLTPTQINLASGALGLVVAYASGGIVTLRAQGVETIKADSIFDELTKEK